MVITLYVYSQPLFIMAPLFTGSHSYHEVQVVAALRAGTCA